MAKIRKDSYGITLEQMKQFFIEHQRARETGDKKAMERIEYHLTYINFHYECALLVGSMISSRRSSKTGETTHHKKKGTTRIWITS